MTNEEQISDAFEAIVSKAVGEQVTLSGRPKRLSGGFWAQIWKVELTNAPAPFDQPIVFRIMPDRIAGLRETVVQQAIAASGFPTPRVLTSGIAPGLGEAYIAMEHIEGKPPIGGLRLGPELFALPQLLRRLPDMLASTATALHAIDPNIIRAIDANIESQVAKHRFRLGIEKAALDYPTAGFGDLARWLDVHEPTFGPDVICHGDLHPLNLLVDDRGLIWLLDWTNATIAPKEMDIGLTAGLLRCAPISAPKLLRPVIAKITHRLAESFITATETTPIDRKAVDWWEVVQLGRCLAMLVEGRLNADGVVGPGHPFEISSNSMIRRLKQFTGVTITPPQRSLNPHPLNGGKPAY